MGATAEELSPTRQEDRENRVLGTHNSIQSRSARDGLFSALTRLLFLDGLSGRRWSSHRAAADWTLPGRLHDINLKARMFIKI